VKEEISPGPNPKSWLEIAREAAYDKGSPSSKPPASNKPVSQSSYIPRVLASLGLAASVIWTILYFANLIFPEQRALFQYLCFPPMALADVITGFYLVRFAVKTEVRGNQSAAIAEVSNR
jgi:hypothetical protein